MGGHESINWDIAHRDTNKAWTARQLVVKLIVGVLYYQAPDSYNPAVTHCIMESETN